MLSFEVISQYTFGDMDVVYLKKGSIYSFTLLPHALRSSILPHRGPLKDTIACREVAKAFHCDFPSVSAESMIQYKVAGDAYAAEHSPGDSMRNSGSVTKLTWVSQTQADNTITTTFTDPHGLTILHTVRVGLKNAYLAVNTTISNTSRETVKLEYLQSFSLGMLSPFQTGSGANDYRIHRYHTFWSAEGREEIATAEALGLEEAWQAAGARTLRFGQRSTMPIKNFFPVVLFEDTQNHVCWGAQIAAPGPWQLEVARKCDYFNISGGLIDREMAFWSKDLKPGENIRGPEAVITCAQGSSDNVNRRLVTYFDEELLPQPQSEADLPVMFNEWCTTWGHPSYDNLMPIAQKLQNRGIQYFVMDDGWFRSDAEPQFVLGDWVESKDKYPHGIQQFCQDLRNLGFVPGVWFEFENALADSQVRQNHPDWFLTIDGQIINVGGRNFLDFRKHEVWNYLDKQMIGMLKRNHIGYMKVDYNAAVPFGVDGPDSMAENLRQHVAAVTRYFQHVRQELPDLVMEICSSGGHRLSPHWLRLGAMGSFSDAHEGVEIPLVAASLTRLIPMRKSQIWATLRPDDDTHRLHYSLAATFMGRFCLSGNMADLHPWQYDTVWEAMDFYQDIKPLIKDGTSHVEQKITGAWNEPEGYQLFTRVKDDRQLWVIHTFANAPQELTIPLPLPCRILRTFKPETVQAQRDDSGQLKVTGLIPFTALAVLLGK